MSGLTSTQHMWIKPVSDGILKIETDDPTLRGSDITMQELGTNVIIITATSKRSGGELLILFSVGLCAHFFFFWTGSNLESWLMLQDVR